MSTTRTHAVARAATKSRMGLTLCSRVTPFGKRVYRDPDSITCAQCKRHRLREIYEGAEKPASGYQGRGDRRASPLDRRETR